MSARIEVEVFDHSYSGVPLPITDHISASYEKVRVAPGTGSVEAPWGSEAAARLKTAYRDHIPVRMSLVDDDHGVRDVWDGWVLDYKVTGAFGNKTIVANCIDAKAVLRGILGWAAPGLVLGVQPGYWFFVGNAVTGILNLVEVNANRLGFPLRVIRPAADASYLINFATRMNPIEDVITDTLPEMEQTMRVRIWRPGEAQPISGTTLTAPTFLVDFKDMVDRPGVVFEEEFGGVEVEEIGTSPKAKTAIIGGKSPDWLNNAVKNLLEQLFSGFGGALNNIFLAFQRFDNPAGSSWGNYLPPESLVAGGGAAYTVDSVQAGRQELVDLGGRRQVKLTITDGRPFSYGIDYRVGDLVHAVTELDDGVLSEQVAAVKVTETRGDGVVIETTIGDDRAPQDGIAKLIGRVKNLVAMIQTLVQGG